MSTNRGTIAIRTCSVCGARADKNSLTRLVNLNGVVTVDETGRMLGRGAYLCDGESADSIGRSHSKIERALRIDIENGDSETHVISLGIKTESKKVVG